MECLQAEFAIDSSAVCDSVASGKSLREFFHIIYANRSKPCTGDLVNLWISAITSARNQHSFMAFVRKRSRNVASEKSTAPGNGDSQGAPPFHAAQT